MYSRLLVVSKDRDIDLEEVQSYELASVPLALANMDGETNQDYFAEGTGNGQSSQEHTSCL